MAAARTAWPAGVRRTPTPIRTAGPPTSTRCWPNVPRAATAPAAPRCPPSCRSAAWWNSAATGPRRYAGCIAGCPPTRPGRLLGTAFHEWVQRFYGSGRLFDLDDLPGAVDGDVRLTETERLAELQEAFAASPWASRTPDVEVPASRWCSASTSCSRIDAVFADPDGGVTVVDWKTGAPPADADTRRQAAVQLGVYRLAWAALQDCPVEQVRTAFHYVRSGQTVVPDDLPTAEALWRCWPSRPHEIRTRRTLSAATIIGICSGRRAMAPSRIGQGLPHHSRTMFTLAGNTATNNAIAAVAPSRRVRGTASSAAVPSSQRRKRGCRSVGCRAVRRE